MWRLIGVWTNYVSAITAISLTISTLLVNCCMCVSYLCQHKLNLLYVQFVVCMHVCNSVLYHGVSSCRQMSLFLCWGKFLRQFWRHSSHLKSVRTDTEIIADINANMCAGVPSEGRSLYPVCSGRCCPCRSEWAPPCPLWECKYGCSGDLQNVDRRQGESVMCYPHAKSVIDFNCSTLTGTHSAL